MTLFVSLPPFELFHQVNLRTHPKADADHTACHWDLDVPRLSIHEGALLAKNQFRNGDAAKALPLIISPSGSRSRQNYVNNSNVEQHIELSNYSHLQ